MPLPRIEAGRLRKRLTIQQITADNPDAAGQLQPTWGTFATVWGSIEPLAGRELWRAQQAQPDVTHKITIRYQSGLTPRMRVLLGARVFNLLEVRTADELNVYQECLAREPV